MAAAAVAEVALPVVALSGAVAVPVHREAAAAPVVALERAPVVAAAAVAGGARVRAVRAAPPSATEERTRPAAPSRRHPARRW